MTANDETKQAEMDAQKIDQIQAQILEDYWANCDGYFEDPRVTTMHLKDVLKHIVAGILQRHIAAATDEISAAMTDEIEALARDRLADLRTQLEARDEA
jgi:hypothetical protein